MQRRAKKRSGDAGGAGGTKSCRHPAKRVYRACLHGNCRVFRFLSASCGCGRKSGNSPRRVCDVRIDLRSCFTFNNGGIRLAFVCGKKPYNEKSQAAVDNSNSSSCFNGAECVYDLRRICFYGGIPRDYSCRIACRKTLCIRMHSHAGRICSSVCLFARCCSCI